MKATRKDIWLIVLLFVVSRIVVSFFGIHFKYDALLKYWQYLDVVTLKHDLLNGIWYDHAQPPFFNFFIGIVLKCTGSYAEQVFAMIFKLITLVNALLLLSLLKRLTVHRYVPVLIVVVYLLSPASIIFENELFYTSFISMLLLISCNFILHFQQEITWKRSIGFFLPLLIVCLTRSMYHLAWLFVISMAVLMYYKRIAGFRKLFAVAVIIFLLVGSWYVKNYLVFGSFSTSSWMGMNFARNVFHDMPVTDSSKIEAIEPFSEISVYKPFISGSYEKKFAGRNDRDLLAEMKNDSFLNANHVSYIEVSQKYMEASKKQIRAAPSHYLKNVAQSSIIFFSPATRYPLAEPEARKIKYYDLLYSFNLSQLTEGKQQRRIALTLSAIPKLLVYVFVFFVLIRNAIRNRRISLLSLFIMLTIAYVFTVSSLLEHYENMRFRYEIEPLFLLLLGQAIVIVMRKRNKVSTEAPGSDC